jgi:hypothetical protein
VPPMTGFFPAHLVNNAREKIPFKRDCAGKGKPHTLMPIQMMLPSAMPRPSIPCLRFRTLLAWVLVSGFMLSGTQCWARLQEDTAHVTTKDLPLVDDAFLHGYTHNEVTDVVQGTNYPTLAIQCVNLSIHQPLEESNEAENSSVWTRDLFWGFLGWSQAGDDHTILRMQSSLDILINCMHRNQAVGANKTWPLADGRFYIPQAFTRGGKVAQAFFPFCSESQADFLLLAHEYWQLSGDDAYIRRIWPDISYVTGTIEKLDSDGNGLPDQLWGSYDYQGLGRNTEEPLMSAKAALAYREVAEMARALGQAKAARQLDKLAERIRVQMNLPVEKGGLWKDLPGGDGYFVNQRNHINEKGGRVDDRFIPYENLVPIFCGMTTKARAEVIFNQLDQRFDQFYPLKWGPMYVAPAIHNKNTVINCSTTPWLGFLDVYLRCKLDHAANQSAIFKLLMDHAYDMPAAPFAEGAGITGNLTGGAGRAWDNGNFFHCLITGIYGVEKTAEGVTISAPVKMADFPLTQLNNLCWRDAVYNLEWHGGGSRIKKVTVDGHQAAKLSGGRYRIAEKTGHIKSLLSWLNDFISLESCQWLSAIFPPIGATRKSVVQSASIQSHVRLARTNASPPERRLSSERGSRSTIVRHGPRGHLPPSTKRWAVYWW